MPSFAAQVRGFAAMSKHRQLAIMKTASANLAEHVNIPIPKGGKMPVVSSFLRNSFAADVGEMPYGPTTADQGIPDDWESNITVTIDGMEPGDTLFMGWTAVYARKQEENHGFHADGLESWQDFVNEAAQEARARIR